MKALLALEDGTYFFGTSIGAQGEAFGEVVFNTSMTGYQEILTDPSYKGQIVCLTYPHIGNYGTNPADLESHRPQVEGFIVRELSNTYSNWRGEERLDEFLRRHSVVGIQGIDTRALTKHIRVLGAMKGAISTLDLDPRSLCHRAAEAPGLIGRDLVREVTCQEPYRLEGDGSLHVVVYDYGVKRNILRNLRRHDCRVTVVPARTLADDVLILRPDGILLSNGPGDPEGVPYAIREVERLIGKKPIFGICLGHQILGIALGLRSFKLLFGHRGANQPVLHIPTGRVEITAQNHGFAVEEGRGDLILTHINLNDRTNEGMRHRGLPIFSVQFHPEASPGPHDANNLFAQFVEMMREYA